MGGTIMGGKIAEALGRFRSVGSIAESDETSLTDSAGVPRSWGATGCLAVAKLAKSFGVSELSNVLAIRRGGLTVPEGSG